MIDVNAKRFVAICTFLTACLSLSLTSKAATPYLYVASALDRIAIGSRPGLTTPAHLWAARGEYEPLQLVIYANTQTLTHVSVSCSDLSGANGIIGANNITLYRERYVTVSNASPDWHASNRTLGPGQYPDILIPFRDELTGAAPRPATYSAGPFTVSSAQNQPIWVDIFIPRNTSPGLYSGLLTVSSDQGTSTMSLQVSVWNFALPLTPSLHSSLLFRQSANIGSTAAQTELLRHRLSPMIVNPTNIGTFQNTFGLNQVGLGFWSGADATNCSMPVPPLVSAIATQLAKLGPGFRTYNYSADEIGNCPAIFPVVRSWAQTLHSVGVRQLITSAPIPALADDGTAQHRSAVDIWAMLPKMYDASPSAVRQAISAGTEAWSYNSMSQDPYSPKLLLDYPLINFRIQPGFLNDAVGLGGFLYWCVDHWSSDPWNNVDLQLNGFHYPGEGLLVYPGAPAGFDTVVPSMRLKQLREGSEDFDYLSLLKNQGDSAWTELASSVVATSWSDWQKDRHTLESTRRMLGQELERVLGNYEGPGPAIAIPSPPGVLPSGTTTYNMTVTTATSATCRYSLTPEVAFAQMTGRFATANGLTHSATLNGLTDGTSYSVYVRCSLASGITNNVDFLEFFRVGQNQSVPVAIYPGNGATSVELSPSISWTAVPGTATYDLYAGFSPSSLLYQGSIVSTQLFPGYLLPATKYYWKVVAKTANSEANASAVVSFTTTSGSK